MKKITPKEVKDWAEIVEEQKDLFHKWKESVQRLSTLNDIIQNDFQKLVEDGVVNEYSLIENIREFNLLFQNRMDTFSDLSFSINHLCQDVISKLKKEIKK